MDSSNERPLFEKHTPIYPLPEGILRMSKDETVCQFCGVSYLIHSEMKKLEDRVKDLEKQLENYELLKLKEKQFKQISDEQNLKIQDLDEKLATRIQMISSLNNDIESRDLEISRLKRKTQDFENDNNTLIMNSEVLKKKMLVYDSVVKETMLCISQLKSELKRLELDSKDQKKLVSQYVLIINTQIQAFIDKNHRESINKVEEIESLRTQLNQLIKTNETQNEQLSHFNRQTESFQNIKAELVSQIKLLNDELNKTKSLSTKFFQLEEEKRYLMEENSAFRNDNDNLKFKLTLSNNEIDQLKQRLTHHQDTYTSVNKTFEKELKLKTEELNRVKAELETLKKQYDEKDKFEKEILNNHQLNMNEVKSLQYEITRLNNQIVDMKNERASMTLAHQCQITQLKDSFKEKMRLNDDWPDKLASELKKQQEKHIQDIQHMEKTLKENFEIEFDIQKQKYNEMYAKYQDISKEFEGNSRSRIADLESEKQKLAGELRNLHEEKLNTEKKLRQDMDNLRNITKELHERLEKYTNESTDEKLKQDVILKNTQITELEVKLKNTETQLENSREEIKVLQETVHNECLERQELLEKLDETREELLLLKKNAYSTQQLIPLKASLNKTNFSQFKNGAGLIDINDPPEKLKSPNYPKTLNDFNGSNQKLNNISTSRRSSGSAGGSNSANENNSMRSPSEKSQSESTSKLIETSPHRRTNMNRANFILNNGSMPTEPVQLFKKINEMNRLTNNQTNSGNSHHSSTNTAADNKKRISLLLARKN